MRTDVRRERSLKYNEYKVQAVSGRGPNFVLELEERESKASSAVVLTDWSDNMLCSNAVLDWTGLCWATELEELYKICTTRTDLTEEVSR